MKKIDTEVKQRRLKAIIEASEISESWQEISSYTSLSYSQVKYLLKQYPEERELVIRNLKNNSGKKTKKSAKESKQPKRTCDLQKSIVLHSSVCWVPNIIDILGEKFGDDVKIITTDVVQSLEDMKKKKDYIGVNASRLLQKAATDAEHYIAVFTKEGKIKNGGLLEFCKTNKDEIVLFAADTGVTLEARALGIKVHFFIKNDDIPSEVSAQLGICQKQRISTLYGAYMVGNVLIWKHHTRDGSLKSMIKDEDNVCINGMCELHVGGDVYILKKKPLYSTFIHYKVAAVSEKDNASYIRSFRIYGNIKEKKKKIPEEYRKVAQELLKA